MPHTNKRTRALDYQESTGYINLQNDHVKNGDASDPVKRTSLKNQIRSVQRLLRRKVRDVYVCFTAVFLQVVGCSAF